MHKLNGKFYCKDGGTVENKKIEIYMGFKGANLPRQISCVYQFKNKAFMCKELE